MAQVTEFPPIMWQTRIEFLAPGRIPDCHRHLGNEAVDGKPFSPPLSKVNLKIIFKKGCLQFSNSNLKTLSFFLVYQNWSTFEERIVNKLLEFYWNQSPKEDGEILKLCLGTHF